MAEVNVVHRAGPSVELERLLPRFGLESFRPGQRGVIQAVADGRDVMCIMPTGGGKSLCYQLPALARKGTTIVVSPLIALMKDQVDALQSRGIDARLLNSSLSLSQQDQVMAEMSGGSVKLVYIAPERLRNNRFLEAVRAARVSLLAIDEAHCVSEWGHDFRPDYARLGRFRSRYLKNVQTIALTATATPTVRDDVCGLLHLDDPKVFVTGFARTNLRFGVDHFQSDTAKNDKLAELINSIEGTGIVYAATRKGCEEIAERLAEQCQRRVGVYHAGLEPAQRQRVQDAFMAGKLAAIVATNAFGMGIDKSDIRYVVHYNMPGSLEAYYQEAGRAGRDGDMSHCRLLFSYQDRYIQEFFIENRYPSRDTVRKVYEYLHSLDADPIELTLDQVREATGVKDSSEAIGTSETLLSKAGVLKRLDSSANNAIVRIDSEAPTMLDFLPREAKRRRKVMTAVEKVIGDRRSEDVYVTPNRLAELAGVERNQLSQSLRELQKLKAFDYVPPFRGRAVHFIERNVPFERLEIDFDELERRKQAEYAKLDSVIAFARTAGCRQRVILQYFGDPKAANCELCDRCDPDGSAVTPSSVDRRSASRQAANLDPALLHRGVQVVLSGVTRTHGRFGKTLVAQMLCGSKSKKLVAWKLNRLSTYGLLASMKQTDVVQVMDGLIASGLLKQEEVDQRRPTVLLTDDGKRVMKAQEELPGSFQLSYPLAKKLTNAVRHLESADVRSAAESPAENPSSGDSAGRSGDTSIHDQTSSADQSPSPDGIDVLSPRATARESTAGQSSRDDLIEVLKRFRRKRSAALGIPPHQVISVATIQRIADRRPGDSSELEAIEGVTPSIVEAIGHDLVELVQSQVSQSTGTTTAVDERGTGGDGTAIFQRIAASPERMDHGELTDFYWTWRLFRDGYDFQQVAQIRRLDADEVRQHLSQAGEAEYEIRAEWDPASGQAQPDN